MRVLEQFLAGAQSAAIRKRLLEKGNSLNLTIALEVARNHAIVEGQSHALAQPPEAVNAVQREHKGPVAKMCAFCNREHVWGKAYCPAADAECNECGRRGHWSVSKRCAKHPQHERSGDSKSPSKGKPKRMGEKKKPVRLVQHGKEEDTMSDEEHESEVHYVSRVTEVPATSMRTNLLVFKKQRSFLIDTGATCNLIDESLIPAGTPLKPCRGLKLYDGSPMEVLGRATAPVRLIKNGTWHEHLVDFIVVPSGADKPRCSILGLPTVMNLELLSPADVVRVRRVETVESRDRWAKLLDHHEAVFRLSSD